jgi:phosphate transport system permease protein
VSTLFDPTAPLTASGNLRRRDFVSRLLEVAAMAAALLAVAVLVIVVYGVAQRGASVLSFSFLTKDAPEFGGAGGGIAAALVGTCLIVAVATILATPVGVMAAVYLVEFAGPRSKFGRALQLALDLMQGMPTIIIGVFVYGALVVAMHRQSGFAGAVALAIVMLPLIARTSQEVLQVVPNSMRAAADALGVSRWRTIRGVILPAAMGGIITGTLLAVARAAGETAPLLLVSSLVKPGTTLDLFGQAIPNVPVLIFTASESADASAFARAWGAALVLLAMILVANVAARLLAARFRSRLGQ